MKFLIRLLFVSRVSLSSPGSISSDGHDPSSTVQEEFGLLTPVELDEDSCDRWVISCVLSTKIVICSIQQHNSKKTAHLHCVSSKHFHVHEQVCWLETCGLFLADIWVILIIFPVCFAPQFIISILHLDHQTSPASLPLPLFRLGQWRWSLVLIVCQRWRQVREDNSY